jgi:hypothetical protein
LCAGKDCIDAQRGGESSPTRVIPARFIAELTRPLSDEAVNAIRGQMQ